MAIDSLYLDNLEEFVNDENKIVTYKWLSVNLKVHVNQAKQMLFTFVQDQRNKKDNDDISVVYFVAGLSKSLDGSQKHKCAVVPEEKLETFKSTLSVITSSHIYSVQKSKIQDSGTLFTADYDTQKEEICNIKNYSAIKYSKAKLRSDSELKTLQTTQQQQAPPDHEKKVNGSATVSNSHGVSSAAAKPQKKTGIAGMFANAAKKAELKKEENKERSKNEKKEDKEEQKSKPATKKGGVMNFFANHTGKKAPVKSEEIKVEKKSPVETKVSPPPQKTQKACGKKSTKRTASDDEDDTKKKRRRIKDVFDSSSEEEMDYESPVPSPVREPSPAPESPTPQYVSEKEESPVKATPDILVKDTPEPGKKRRIRRRKQVPKTFMDEDGYMVTEKVWESESTDASDIEPPTKQEPKQHKQTPQKKPSPTKKKSPPSPQSRKQTALTSFFRKK